MYTIVQFFTDGHVEHAAAFGQFTDKDSAWDYAKECATIQCKQADVQEHIEMRAGDCAVVCSDEFSLWVVEVQHAGAQVLHVRSADGTEAADVSIKCLRAATLLRDADSALDYARSDANAIAYPNLAQ